MCGQEILLATPAYGRDYTKNHDINKDWIEGKDFQIHDIGSPYNNRYFSVRDTNKMLADGIRYVNIRYNCLSRVHVIKLD